MNARPIAIALCAALAACGGVSYHVAQDVPMPRSLAVLPFAGDAAPGVRAGARSLLHSRLHARGYLTPELAWVDHVLAQHGWLRDVEHFDPSSVAPAELTAALGVDAVVFGREIDERSFNLLLLRRQRVSAAFTVTVADGRNYWSAEHGAGAFGGFLLGSGQVFTELRALGDHGTSMHTLALVDQLTAEAAETVPTQTESELPPQRASLAEAGVARTPLADGRERIVVTAHADPAQVLSFDVVPGSSGIPMVSLPDGTFRGTHDLDAHAVPVAVVVHSTDAFGRRSELSISQLIKP